MRAVSLPRFLPGLVYARMAVIAVLVLLVTIGLYVLFVTGGSGVSVTTPVLTIDPLKPFRW